MPLVTIADLGTVSREEKQMYVDRARQLSTYYELWKSHDTGGYAYTVDIPSSGGRGGGVHASEISGCPRIVVYSIMLTERRPPVEEADVNMKMRFNIGHAVHAMLQHEFGLMCAWISKQPEWEDSAQKITFRSEIRIAPGEKGMTEAVEDWDLHSSCDGEFTWWKVDDPILRIGTEIKTASPGEYDKTNKPKPEHAEQTCFYQAALDLPLMWVIYYNKANCYYTKSEAPWLFQFNQHLWDTQLEPRFAKAHHLAETGKLPPRVEGRRCRWCPYAWTCNPPFLARGRQPRRGMRP